MCPDNFLKDCIAIETFCLTNFGTCSPIGTLNVVILHVLSLSLT